MTKKAIDRMVEQDAETKEVWEKARKSVERLISAIEELRKATAAVECANLKFGEMCHVIEVADGIENLAIALDEPLREVSNKDGETFDVVYTDEATFIEATGRIA